MQHLQKAGRIAAEGIVAIHLSDDNKVGAIVEVNSETDFVAKNQKFRDYVDAVAKQVTKIKCSRYGCFLLKHGKMTHNLQ